MKLTRSLLACALLSALASTSANSATVTGKVTDEQGNAISKAELSVEGYAKTVLTDENGHYTISNIDPEHVHIHVYSESHIHGNREIGSIEDNYVADFVLTSSSIENIVITANALRTSVLESVTPVTVLNKEELLEKQAATLGETLKSIPGVHTNYFGPVASSPIIRGTDGPRVKIVQNGLDVSDASRVGPDHNVAVDVANAQQVEVLRGPATLQYGSGAVGGVVNIVDNRIPKTSPEGLEGQAELRFDTVSDEEFAKVDVTGGTESIAFHFDAFTRDTGNYEIPGFAEAEPEEGEEKTGTLSNSSIDTTSYTAGLSFVGDKGYIGFSFQQLDNFYGIPGHGGHEEEEEGHDDGDADGHEEEEEEVNLDVDMQRVQVAGEWFAPIKGISKISYSGGVTDYEHVEFENGFVGTTFTNETSEHRISIEHENIAGWHGVVGIQQSSVDYAADGEEAFTPPSETDTFAMFVIEQRTFGDVTVELGARYESNDVDPIDVVEVDFELIGGHDEEEGHEEEEEGHDEEESHQEFDLAEQNFDSLSFSAGANWLYTENRSVSVSLSHSERAPSHQELFSAGNHISTRTFDVGTIYTLDEDGELSLNSEGSEQEISTNLDLTLRKFGGDWGYSVSVFYNQIDDYLYQANTGFEVEAGHEEEGHDEEGFEEEGHDEEEGHGEEEGNPVFLFQQQDADFYGIEAEFHANLNEYFAVQVFGDVIRARLDSPINGSRNLPRIPPAKLGAELEFNYDNWYGDIGLTFYDDQTRVTTFETETDGYTLLDMSVNYRQEYKNVDWIFFLRGKNLTDEEARVHSSFIKDLAPLPGRSFALGVRAEF